ncbi:MAG: DUF4468 domain-containing protein [Bacteroidales bacterium]|nr:DUF4468 domain-containing protein [Bacteroidales bacterium]
MSDIKMILAPVFILVLTNTVFTQTQDSVSFPVDEDTKIITYQEVVQAEGAANELFYRAVTWMNDYWDNPRGIIEKQDRMNGVIKARPRFDIKKENEEGVKIQSGRMAYILKMEFRDGRFRYTITDIKLLKTSPFPLERWINPESRYYDQRDPETMRIIAEEIQQVIDSMKEGMKKEEDNSGDDW